MEFVFTVAEDNFRQEVREFLKKELPSDWNWLDDEFADDLARWDVAQAVKQKMAKRGWLALSWPKEYGGQGASHMTQTIYNEELAYHRAPGRDIFGARMLGPTLMIHGTVEQREAHLPPIARGEIQWCQGYSEPENGSDLAGIQLRGIEDGDDFVLNGSKIWTSRAHVSDAIFLLARTNQDAPKHKGISFLLCDLGSPGIEIRPIVNMAGIHQFNQVFFDNVRVPKINLVGQKDRGWYVAATLLDFERSGVEYSAEGKRTIEELVLYARQTVRRGISLAEDPRIRNALAEMAIEVNVSRLLSYRIAWLQSHGQVPNKEASMGKLFGTEMAQRITNLAMQILGPYGQLMPGNRWTPMGGLVPRQFLNSPRYTLAGGTSEIQRNIIATRGLGLPRM